jgi:deoxyribodipyrimidine photo-lyase
VRRWLPELRRVPDEYLFEPATMPLALQKEQQFLIGPDYPEPIVDHLTSAKLARDLLWSLRRDPQMREEARQVFVKHGSRNPMREGRSRSSAKSSTKSSADKSAEPKPQLPLALD